MNGFAAEMLDQPGEVSCVLEVGPRSDTVLAPAVTPFGWWLGARFAEDAASLVLLGSCSGPCSRWLGGSPAWCW